MFCPMYILYNKFAYIFSCAFNTHVKACGSLSYRKSKKLTAWMTASETTGIFQNKIL